MLYWVPVVTTSRVPFKTMCVMVTVVAQVSFTYVSLLAVRVLVYSMELAVMLLLKRLGYRVTMIVLIFKMMRVMVLVIVWACFIRVRWGSVSCLAWSMG